MAGRVGRTSPIRTGRPPNGPSRLVRLVDRLPSRSALRGTGVLVFLIALPGLGLVLPGIDAEVEAWPFAVYPVFAGLHEPTQSTLLLVPVVDGVEVEPLEAADVFGEWMTAHQYHGLVTSLLASSTRDAQLEAIFDELERRGRTEGLDALRFYRIEVDIEPGPTRGQLVRPPKLLLEAAR